jgi:puromycin-sensitive aminopeptidase
MNTSVRALEYYDKFFDVPYPLPKYECIAIADFACGAMENWGLVTYRQVIVTLHTHQLILFCKPERTCLHLLSIHIFFYRESCVLVDPQKTSSAIKQWVAIVVNHEMAHQWFGNLVTMEWWTHIWLNEGFASFMENECTNTLFPEFDIWTQFVSNALIAALELDSLENSHPIEVEVGHPSEVDEIFDKISYFKVKFNIVVITRLIVDC